GEPGYKTELRALQAELESRRTVPEVQAWLANSGATPQLLRDKWPTALSELSPEGVSLARGCGGVTGMIRRGRNFTGTICPPGTRPKVSSHEPSMERPGYVGEFGPDAYITMTER